ncbi:MAG: hypothetical protein U0Z44_11125 [Kouleothrix sp.]
MRGDAGPQAYAPYMLTHLPDAAPAASISAVLEAFYATYEQISSHQQRRGDAQPAAGRPRAAPGATAWQPSWRAGELERLRWDAR